MDLETKCSVIEEFTREYVLHDEHRDYDIEGFLEYNDIGVPLAQSVSYNLAMPTTEGVLVLQETWILFCEMVGVNPDDEFEDLDDLLDTLEDDQD